MHGPGSLNIVTIKKLAPGDHESESYYASALVKSKLFPDKVQTVIQDRKEGKKKKFLVKLKKIKKKQWVNSDCLSEKVKRDYYQRKN